MSKPITITVESAARLIGGNGIRWLAAAGRLRSTDWLVSPAVPGPGTLTGLSLLDRRSKLMQMTRGLAAAARSQASARHGLARTNIVLASHAVTVTSAFLMTGATEAGEWCAQMDFSNDDKAWLAVHSAPEPSGETRRNALTLASTPVPPQLRRMDWMAPDRWDAALGLAEHCFRVDRALGGALLPCGPEKESLRRSR